MFEHKFSRYEIREELGIGGMATVYRAYDPLFEREVAVKLLKRELIEDTQQRERFERETKIIARLEHPAIVPVYDVGNDNSQMFYVMRFMTGGSLSERITEGTLTSNQIAHITMRIAEALDYAHRKGIVHRDLKPGNILFDEVNNAYISDFGIAKFTQASTRITNAGILGTPRYMSPEQARGEEADGRSDQYSLAVILFEMLSGKAPFEANTPLALAIKHATEPAPKIREINPKLPETLSNVLNKALEKDPANRYKTCVEFADAFLNALPDSSTPDISSITPLPPLIYKNTESPTELPSRPIIQPRTRSYIRLLLEFILVILLGLAIWRYPKLTAITNASTSTPTSATATTVPITPTAFPTETAVPTMTVKPTSIPVDPGIGGANQIALTANRDIYLMDMDGNNIRQLTNTNIPKAELQWLPGGKELLYIEGKCVYILNVKISQPEPEKMVCFNNANFEGFRVSPDGTYVAISIEHRLIVLPYDPEQLSTIASAFELQNLDDVCLDYSEVAVKDAQWSKDGKSLAIRYQSVVGQRIGDIIRVLSVDKVRCQQVDPLILDEFPARRFTPDGYETYPLLPSYDWDGTERFLFNTYKRNGGYGELYLYDMSTTLGSKIDPIDDVCCYRSTTFSPDGKYILFVFQDIREGAESESQLYYIPTNKIGTDTTFAPIRLPLRFFPDVRENILLALHTPTQ